MAFPLRFSLLPIDEFSQLCIQLRIYLCVYISIYVDMHPLYELICANSYDSNYLFIYFTFYLSIQGHIYSSFFPSMYFWTCLFCIESVYASVDPTFVKTESSPIFWIGISVLFLHTAIYKFVNVARNLRTFQIIFISTSFFGVSSQWSLYSSTLN